MVRVDLAMPWREEWGKVHGKWNPLLAGSTRFMVTVAGLSGVMLETLATSGGDEVKESGVIGDVARASKMNICAA